MSSLSLRLTPTTPVTNVLPEWKINIIEQLKKRDQIEGGSYKDLITGNFLHFKPMIVFHCRMEIRTIKFVYFLN